jgi:hypothetical protein
MQGDKPSVTSFHRSIKGAIVCVFLDGRWLVIAGDRQRADRLRGKLADYGNRECEQTDGRKRQREEEEEQGWREQPEDQPVEDLTGTSVSVGVVGEYGQYGTKDRQRRQKTGQMRAQHCGEDLQLSADAPVVWTVFIASPFERPPAAGKTRSAARSRWPGRASVLSLRLRAG